MQKRLLEGLFDFPYLVMLFFLCYLAEMPVSSDHVNDKAFVDDNKQMDSQRNEKVLKLQNPHSVNTSSNISLTKRDIYEAGFQVKRVHQIAAVKDILKLSDYSKQYKMVDIILQKIFQILSKAKMTITQSSYVPGQEFPQDETELDALAHIVENTAFFGDILLRMPDITHKIYKSNNDWRMLVHWGIGFCNETGLFSGANEKLISLVAQELNLIPRDANYINPYKAQYQKTQKKASESKNEHSNQKSKRKHKKIRKGPKLSRTEF